MRINSESMPFRHRQPLQILGRRRRILAFDTVRNYISNLFYFVL